MIVAIGGGAGSGKSSVSRALAAKLGYKYYSGGELFRKGAAARGFSLPDYNIQAVSEKEIDLALDEALKKIGQSEDNLVLESRLGFFLIPHSVKIFLTAEDKIRAKRTMEEGRAQEAHKSFEEAIRKLAVRDNCDQERYKELYGVDLFHPKNYDLIVNTSHKTVEQTVNLIYDFVMKKMKKQK